MSTRILSVGLGFVVGGGLCLGLGLGLVGCGSSGSGAENPPSDGSVTEPPDGGVKPLDPPLQPGDPGQSDIRFTITTTGTLRSISPLIYGVNGTPKLVAESARNCTQRRQPFDCI